MKAKLTIKEQIIISLEESNRPNPMLGSLVGGFLSIMIACNSMEILDQATDSLNKTFDPVV